MSRPRTYDRRRDKRTGLQYLVLHKGEALKQLNLSMAKDEGDLARAVELLNKFAKMGEKWFWMETGADLQVEATKDGHDWMVVDTMDNSRRAAYFCKKVQSYERRIIRRVNSMLEEGKGVPSKPR